MTIKDADRAGRAVTVVEPTDQGFELNADALLDILLQPEIANKKVAVVSVAGAYRKGKSFLLNFFVHYLECLERGKVASTDWCSVDTVLDKFPWRTGSKPDTRGILLWSRPFTLKADNGEDIVVLLMDTQGAFDSQTTVKECVGIFALSTMLSSLQIFNLSMNLQEDNLQHLSLFTEYAKLAAQYDSAKPFQNLMFLIRDWQHSHEVAYGFAGGEEFMRSKLATSGTQSAELRELRQQLRGSFECLECFLMPHPGLRVANNNTSAKLGEVEQDFVARMREFVPAVFASKRLMAKKIAGSTVTAKGLFQHFVSYTKIFNSGRLPEPRSILAATADAMYIEALEELKKAYSTKTAEDPKLANPAKLLSLHEAAEADVLNRFDKIEKFGNDKMRDKYRMELHDYMQSHYASRRTMVLEYERVQAREEEARKKEAENKKREDELKKAKVEEERRKGELAEAEKRLQREKEEAERRKKEAEEKLRQEQKRMEEERQRIEKERAEQARKAEELRQEQQRMKEERDRMRREEERNRVAMSYVAMNQPAYSMGGGGSRAPSRASSSSSSGGNRVTVNGQSYTIDRNGRYHDSRGHFARDPFQ